MDVFYIKLDIIEEKLVNWKIDQKKIPRMEHRIKKRCNYEERVRNKGYNWEGYLEFQEEESTNAIFEEIIVENIPPNDEQYPVTYLRNPTISKWVYTELKLWKLKIKTF